jgi:hypothetical protein
MDSAMQFWSSTIFSAYKFISNGDPKSQNEVQNTIVAAQKHLQLETHIT